MFLVYIGSLFLPLVDEEPLLRKDVTMVSYHQPLNVEIFYKRGLLGISIVFIGVMAAKLGLVNLDSFAIQVVFLNLALLAGISSTWSA